MAAANGNDPVDLAAAVADTRELGTVDDTAAVLDWRIGGALPVGARAAAGDDAASFTETKSAEDAVTRSEKLVVLRERFLAEAAMTRSKLFALVGLLFANPFLTVARVEKAVGLTNQGARNLMDIIDSAVAYE